MFARAVILVALTLACGSSSGTVAPASTPLRCSDGRPQSEIDHAGRLPLEPHSNLTTCVLIASDGSRVYRLADGRTLQLYERAGGLPVKPSAAPTQEGTQMLSGRIWSWKTVNGVTVLSTTMPDLLYVELSTSTRSVSGDVDLLSRIAATLSGRR